MGPTKKQILIEDLALVQKRLDFLQQTVPANDIWQNQLLWEHTKILNDILEKEINKNEKVSESDPQGESGEAEVQEQ